MPDAKALLDEEALVILGEFVVQTRSGDIGELHLHFLGGGGGSAAFGDITNATTSSLNHLIVRAARFFDETITEDDRGVIDRLGDSVAAKVLITSMRHQGTVGVGRHGRISSDESDWSDPSDSSDGPEM